jgi:hypothetical protein
MVIFILLCPVAQGVLYSHRAQVLHALSVSMPDALCLSARSVILAIVPMFHANSWGLAFAAPLTGAKLVLPGETLLHLSCLGAAHACAGGAYAGALLHDERASFARLGSGRC